MNLLDPGELTDRPMLWRYLVAIASVGVALTIYLQLGALAQQFPFILFIVAIAFSAWYGGLGPGLLASVLSALGSAYFFLPPLFSFDLSEPRTQAGLGLFALVAVLINLLSEARTRAEREMREGQARLRATLASIGDAVIATDTQGRVTFMNGVAEQLIGWSAAEASGKELREVFRIVNEESRAPVENPVSKVLKTGMVVGLANHTVLISRDGTERPIDDSGAPIRGDRGRVSGWCWYSGTLPKGGGPSRSGPRRCMPARSFSSSYRTT